MAKREVVTRKITKDHRLRPPRFARQYKTIDGRAFTICLLCGMRETVAAYARGVEFNEAPVSTFPESVDEHFAKHHPDEAAVAEELMLLYTQLQIHAVMGDDDL